jgi:hypothetical protein
MKSRANEVASSIRKGWLIYRDFVVVVGCSR